MNDKEFTELIQLGQAIGLMTFKRLFEFGEQKGAKTNAELLAAVRAEFRKRLDYTLEIGSVVYCNVRGKK